MEDGEFQNQRLVKRRLMEAAQGGAQVRRLHIVYFLSRKDRIEQPHLIRVHHLSRTGVRLKDIKRWLGELRGKDMPESFAWSYKRRYRADYVWQDLLDDDLITPISDNEYVLKGSEIFSATNNMDFSLQKELSSLQESSTDNKNTSSEEEKQGLSSEIEGSSPYFGSETSSLTYTSGKLQMDKNYDITKQENQDENSSPFHSTVHLNKKNKRTKEVKIDEETVSTTAASSNITSSDKPHSTKNKTFSNGASHIFRNLITCGGVDTNDSAVVMTHKQSRSFLNMCSGHQRSVLPPEMCKRERLEGTQIVLGTPNWTQHQWSKSKSSNGVKDSAKRKGQFRQPGPAPSAAYKPLNGPNCSQCGKPFKPEKLHSHMKSCKGKKALAKGYNPPISATAAESTSNISTESRNEDSVSAYLLTH